MITFTKEQLIASAHARIEFAEMMLSGELEPLKERTWSIELDLARIALASLEAEPVGEVALGEYDDCGCYPDARVVCIAADGQADWENFKDGTRLYAAPPATISVPDEVLKRLLPDAEKAEFWFEHDGKILFEGVKFNNAVFEACRGAMLQGAENAESRCSNSPVIPDGWVACSERMPDVGEIVLTSDGSSVNVGESERSGVNLRFFTSIFSGRELPATHWMPLPAAPQQEA